MDRLDPDNAGEDFVSDADETLNTDDFLRADEVDADDVVGGPDTAELIATRAELKRVEAENAELKDRFARRQADFENYRKRVERERTETYNRVVADVTTKLLPVLDNLKRALEAEASVEAAESDEFRHFLSGVDLICKQLNGVLEALGVKPIPAVGEKFDPHVHEAVVTEATDDYDPDMVMQEIVAGYRLGDKLIRPALVKVATRK
ncbi:MAG TPA: nucleotide exchange factor GrpE [Pyrinomonadaceae bacterium]|nr:nucleotide exchange factor GrpE [Pyrinomonadaceae bacterium]